MVSLSLLTFRAFWTRDCCLIVPYDTSPAPLYKTVFVGLILALVLGSVDDKIHGQKSANTLNSVLIVILFLFRALPEIEVLLLISSLTCPRDRTN